MLFIDGKKSSVQDLIDLINKNKKTQLTKKELENKFKKNPEFEINPVTDVIHLGKSRQIGREIKKEAMPVNVLTKFNFYSVIDGVEHEIRYTDVMPHKNAKTELMVYKPKTLHLEAPFNSVADAGTHGFEKMLFLYFHPNHHNSPLHKAGSVYKYTHVDNDAKHEQVMKQNNDTIMVVNHIDRLEQNELIIYAKSIGLHIEDSTYEQVKVLMQSKALRNELVAGKYFIQAYKEIMDNSHIMFKGQVIDAIDQGHIKSHISGQSQIWRFDIPTNKSEICSTSTGVNAIEELINYIKANPADRVSTILALFRQKGIDDDFKSIYAKEQGKVEKVAFKTEQETIEFSDVDSNSKAKAFLKLFFDKNPSPENASKFFKAVDSGEVNEANWSEKIYDYAPANFVRS